MNKHQLPIAIPTKLNINIACLLHHTTIIIPHTILNLIFAVPLQTLDIPDKNRRLEQLLFTPRLANSKHQKDY